MIRKACIIGTLAAAMAFTAAHGSPAYVRLRNFHQYFQALKNAGDSVGPLERFVFSLVLANAKPTPPEPQATTPPHRT